MSQQSPKQSLTQTKKTLYELDKTLGRRDEAGRWNVKVLKPQHKHMIAAHYKGWPNKLIAEKFGISEGTVSRILNDPLAKEFLGVMYLGIEQELRGLATSAIDVVREGLASSDVELGLKAIDKYDKLVKLLTPEGRELSKGGSIAVQINNGGAANNQGDAMEKLLEKLNKWAEKESDSKYIDQLAEVPPRGEIIEDAEIVTNGEQHDS